MVKFIAGIEKRLYLTARLKEADEIIRRYLE